VRTINRQTISGKRSNKHVSKEPVLDKKNEIAAIELLLGSFYMQ